ncbi:hypothetical protein NLL38_04275 [Corynebacterium accolens]|uniref:Uncharacterized protein n=1 Tax=Corynebacterium accolens TaxID=38284 RepID=A0ABT7FQD2_9CORY|nr:hypothetical protein [Corynebacterium accolens]DAX96060.1 MAG TPA: hypothetical protein [Caudoviricetes sp.]MDK4247803.1 hypothetical protein [Corynebacterium accolens]MDK4337262.1 hypothetical protein [Corynebacterium accolens]WKS68995.1 hypothetical protein NLL40_11680 [Corynebacterium accolens]WKS72139.1 hypothetical protein NLL38_04275 [Corynebacterium accolens]
MPLFAPESIYPSRESRKVSLARLEAEVIDWAKAHGDTFPVLRDLCHEIEVQIDTERTQL